MNRSETPRQTCGATRVLVRLLLPLAFCFVCISIVGKPTTTFAQTPIKAPTHNLLHRQIDQSAAAIENKVIAWRRDIHQYPELSNREFRTSKLIARHLTKLGLKVQTEVGVTGVVGLLEGTKPGPVVALRADMDALPVVEQTGLPYASQERSDYEGSEVGVMHACGHDNHVAILMGVAQVLAELRQQLPGTVKFIFQPAEEGPPKGEVGGAELMVKQGALRNPSVDAIFGLHITQGDRVGSAGYRSGAAMASAQRFDIRIEGRQTHGASPWDGIDPIVVGVDIVQALQTIVSREVDITRSAAVVSVGSFHAGTRNNIIPNEAKLSGTIRTFDGKVHEFIQQRIRKTVASIAEIYGATAHVEFDRLIPVTFNDPQLTERMLPSLRRVYGANRVHETPATTGAEDFSYFQEEVPGLFYFIGGRPSAVPASDAIPNHSPLFYVDEAALLPGVRGLASLAVDYLTRVQTRVQTRPQSQAQD